MDAGSEILKNIEIANKPKKPKPRELCFSAQTKKICPNLLSRLVRKKIYNRATGEMEYNKKLPSEIPTKLLVYLDEIGMFLESEYVSDTGKSRKIRVFRDKKYGVTEKSLIMFHSEEMAKQFFKDCGLIDKYGNEPNYK